MLNTLFRMMQKKNTKPRPRDRLRDPSLTSVICSLTLMMLFPMKQIMILVFLTIIDAGSSNTSLISYFLLLLYHLFRIISFISYYHLFIIISFIQYYIAYLVLYRLISFIISFSIIIYKISRFFMRLQTIVYMIFDVLNVVC